MAIISGGEIVLSDTTPTFARTNYSANTGLNLTAMFATYGELYRRQLWVSVVVNKRAAATKRLPLKVYKRNAVGREEARETPYARLLRRPNPHHDPAFFWEWTSSTFDIYGEAMWLKIRGRDGLPRELWPVHPSLISIIRLPNPATDEVETFYGYLGGAASSMPQLLIPERDVVHFKTFNPDTTMRGLSKLEPLRQTLVNEDAARRATSSFWAKGARPAVALVHKGVLSDAAAKRLRTNWDNLHGGVDNTGNTAVLEEGMEPKIIPLNLEEAQYIDTRKLNREEVCAEFDMPPPAVHILDRATFSNITEQMRSIYRDTMAPHLGGFESVMDHQLRPEFAGEDTYAEFLMDQVLRGSFEERADKIQAAINSGQLTPNEGRALDNRPALPGGDRLYINSTMVPVEDHSAAPNTMSSRQLAEALQKIYLAVNTVITPDEAREILNREGAGLTGAGPTPKGLTNDQIRTVMSRLGRAESLADVDLKQLTKDLNGSADTVASALRESSSLGQFKSRLKSLSIEGGRG